ncbi:MAG: M14 family zinc carboxypeptidase [Abyssibacter sp.]|uniref:M14 family zinc carboxypeptidase n=1 Tax=Abyssibacter sp. TaxID=2320200 RepID=UPI00321AFEDD
MIVQFARACGLALSLILSLPALSAGQMLPMPLANGAQGCLEIAGLLGSVSRSDCQVVEFAAADVGTVEQRPILTADFPATQTLPVEKRPARVLLIGGVHGDEYSAVSIQFRWAKYLADDAARRYHWRMLPCLNPDGLLAGPATRYNANGVDLNRNFPTLAWDQRALPYWTEQTGRDPRRYPGPSAASEPETQWLIDEIDRFKPDVIVSVHAPLGVLDFDGPPPPPPQLGILQLDRLGAYPGSLGNYAGRTLGIPVLTPELHYAGIMPTQAEIREMWVDLIDWLDAHIADRPLPLAPRPILPDWRDLLAPPEALLFRPAAT